MTGKVVRYAIRDTIGSGGLSTVYRIQDPEGRSFAMKRFRTEITDVKQVQRFRQEARIQSALSHPNIVPVIAANLSEDPPFYVMPLADGCLSNRIDDIAKSPDSLVGITEQLIVGLAYAHAQNVWHRDMKPLNVLFFGQIVKIGDFGLGKAPDLEVSFQTTSGDRWATVLYAPPEQLRGLKHCDHRSDIFSLGKLLLHCLTSVPPGQIPQDLDKRWAYLIRRCICDRKEDRWQSTAELHRQFKMVFGIDEALVVDPEDILGQIAHLAQTTSALTADDVRDFAAKIALISDDEVLTRQVFDVLPPNLLLAWAEHDSEGLAQFVRVYDEALPDHMSFEYCDVIADQYAAVHRASSDYGLRELLRRRLFTLGPDHNRWHVGSVLAGIAESISEPSEIVSVCELIRSDARCSNWHSEYMQKPTIDKRIRNALEQD